MRAEPGRQISNYTLISLLGRGGMGEVWRARDAVLDRDVAIKLLPPEFLADPDRLERFEREARILAQLEHPNVATILGLEQSDGACFLVMRLVEGEDLESRVGAGRLAVGEVTHIARQIASGLEAAHRKGIVHRDLKPGNVMLDTDGGVQILDFGMAKILAGSTGIIPDVSEGETLPANAVTRVGTLLGTAAYMAPEQAEGRAVDERTDVWAFGVLLWEMLTGQRLFASETISGTLAAVLAREIDLDALPGETPAHVRWIVERCLVRDPRKRLQDIAEARVLLEDPSMAPFRAVLNEQTIESLAPGLLEGRRERGAAGSGASRWGWRSAALALLVLAAALAAGLLLWPEGAPRPTEALHVSLPYPSGTRPALGGIQPGPAVVSPDGRTIALVAEDDAVGRRIWIRDLHSSRMRMLEGTEDASYPFWSPDGEHLGFFAGQKLKRVPAAGGTVRTLCDAPTPKGGTWNRDGLILFNAAFDVGLSTIPADGGTPTALTELEPGELSHRFPQFLDDSRFTFLIRRADDRENVTAIASLETPDDRQVVVQSPLNSLVSDEHILFFREGALLAQGFDPASGRVRGSPVVLLDEVGALPGSVRLLASIGPRMLVNQLWDGDALDQMSLLDGSGRLVRQLATGTYDNPDLSPDGRTLATHTTINGNQQIVLFDLATGNRELFTVGPDLKVGPLWSPEGDRIAYSTNASGARRLVAKSLSTAGSEAESGLETLVENDDPLLFLDAMDWVRDTNGDAAFIYSVGRNDVPGHEMMLSVLDGRPDRKLVQTESGFPEARLSPDGRWMSYRTGTDPLDPVVFVTDLPNLSRRFEILRGWSCRWIGDGREMLCLDSDSNLLRFQVRATGSTFEWGPPEVLFSLRNRWWVGDGESFVISEPFREREVGQIDIVMDWETLVD